MTTTENSKWYVLFVVQGKEFAIKNSLELLSTTTDRLHEILLPTLSEISEIKRKKIVKKIPIYPSYLFIKANLCDELQSFILNEINFVIKFLGYKEPLAINFQEIEIVKAISCENKTYSSFKYKIDDVIEILGGHCKGLSGRIVEIIDSTHLKIEIQIFNRAIYTNLKVDDVRMA